MTTAKQGMPLMLKCFYAAALLAGVSGAAFAAPATGPSPILQQADLFSLEAAASPQISPDGSKIAYVRLSGDVMSDRMRPRSEEHTSELPSLMRISYAVFCLKKKKQTPINKHKTNHIQTTL